MMLKITMVQRVVAGLTFLLALLAKALVVLRRQNKQIRPLQPQPSHNYKQIEMIDEESSSPSQSLLSEVDDDERYGLSWRLAVETNKVGKWRTVPLRCYNHVHNYMTGGQYEQDLTLIVHQISSYASQIPLSGDGFDAWILDVDDTCISNVSYYEANRFGYVLINSPIYTTSTHHAFAIPIQCNKKYLS